MPSDVSTRPTPAPERIFIRTHDFREAIAWPHGWICANGRRQTLSLLRLEPLGPAPYRPAQLRVLKGGERHG